MLWACTGAPGLRLARAWLGTVRFYIRRRSPQARRLLRPGTSPMLSIRGVKTYYGNIMALRGVDLDVDAGEIVTLIGANGAGKSTLMMTIFGTPARARGPRSLFEGRDITGLRDARDRAAAHRPVARGPAHLPAHDRAREPADGRRASTAGAHFAEDLERVYDALPAPQGAARSARRHAVGRRAADAGHRPRADEPAEAAAARRALAGPRTADRQADLRGDPRPQPAARA